MSLRRFVTARIPESVRDRYRESCYDRCSRFGTFWRGILRRVRRRPFPVNPDGAVRLHLGCGRIDKPGFINVDVIAFPHVHVVSDIGRLGFLADECVDLIYTSHCLEHIPHAKVPAVLAEFRRVLKRGATLRISVPDFDVILRAYRDHGGDSWVIRNQLFGGQEYPSNFHYCIFSRSALSRVLEENGFTRVREWVPGDGELKTFHDWSGKTVPIGGADYAISLNLEADKA